VMNERRVELAFEDHRFWDMRRWRIGDQTKILHGVQIVKQANGALIFNPIIVDQRVWDDKMYLYPFPYNETIINPNLTQNPGW